MADVKELEVIDTNVEEVVEEKGYIAKGVDFVVKNKKPIIIGFFGALTLGVGLKVAQSFGNKNFIDVSDNIEKVTENIETLTEEIN